MNKYRKVCVEFDDTTYLLLQREAKEFNIILSSYVESLIRLTLFPEPMKKNSRWRRAK